MSEKPRFFKNEGPCMDILDHMGGANLGPSRLATCIKIAKSSV